MSYSGLGFRPTSTIQKPKRVFKPVFEQMSSGEHPVKSKNTNPAISWSQVRQHLDLEERNSESLSTKIFLFVLLATLFAFVVSVTM